MRYRVYSDDILIHDTYIPDASMHLIDAKCKMGDNTAGSFNFKVAPSNPGYNSIKRLSSTIYLYEDDDIIWSGRVVSENEDFWKRRSFTCEGALAYLNDTCTSIAKYNNVQLYHFLYLLISAHNSRVSSVRQLHLGAITMDDPDSEIGYETNNETTWETISKTFIERLGGHLCVTYSSSRVAYLNYYDDYPNTSSQEINFGSNLLDFTKDWDMSEIATVILPRGKEIEQDNNENTGNEDDQKKYVTIKSVNNGSEYLKNDNAYNTYGRIERIVDFNDIEDPATLKKMATIYLRSMQFDTMTLTVSAVDLHHLYSYVRKFSLLDNVHCISKPHGLDTDFPIIEMELDINVPSNTTYTLGKSNAKSLSGVTTASAINAKDRIDAINLNGDVLALAKDQATAILNQRTTGYVNIVQYNDISQALIISNRPNYTDSNAQLWKFDMNGLGYSPNTKPDGTRDYTIAITNDGTIVADRIKTGRLSDGLGTNYWDLSTGEISIQSGAIVIQNDSSNVYTLADMYNDFTTMDESVSTALEQANTASSVADSANTNASNAATTASRANTTANQAKEQYNTIAGKEYGCVNLLNGSGVLNIGNSAHWDTRNWATYMLHTVGRVDQHMFIKDATKNVTGINPPNTMIQKCLHINYAGNHSFINSNLLAIKQIMVPLEPNTVYVASMYYNIPRCWHTSNVNYTKVTRCYPYISILGGNYRIDRDGDGQYLKWGRSVKTWYFDDPKIANNKWNRVSYVFKTADREPKYEDPENKIILNANDVVDVVFGINTDLHVRCEGFFCGFKLEKGNTPTDWFPSIKDIDSTAVTYSKKFSDNIGEQAKTETKKQLKAYDESLKYETVLKKLTSGYKNVGIYQGYYTEADKRNRRLSLLINATYLRSGVIDAGLIKTGWIMDKQKANKWNLVTGYLETKNMKAINIQATGSFQCGTKTGYAIQMINGVMDGYRQGKWVGSISPTASIYDINSRRHEYGLSLRAQGNIDIRSPSISVRNRNDTGVSTTALTGKIDFKYVHGIVGNGGQISWVTRHAGFHVINGLVVSMYC